MNSALASSRPGSKFSSGRIALLITLCIESVFFLTVLVAYAALRDQVNWNVPKTISNLSFPIINTMLLFVSAGFAWQTNSAFHASRQSAIQTGLLLNVLLGMVFVAGQVFEFNRLGLNIDDPSFGGVFFTLIGFHAVHVLAGVFFLFINLMRARLGDFKAGRHEAVEFSTWFWYYVTGVWVVLFIALYLI